MGYKTRVETRELALMCVFGALYAVFSLVSLFPIIGALGAFITMATVLAPVLGMLLGPYTGATSASIGGFIGWAITQSGAFGFASFIPGAISAFTAGLLTRRRRMVAVVFYLVLFLPMAFFPVIGPFWLHPLYLWFQLVGIIILASPASAIASAFTTSNSVAKLALGIGLVALVSTLTGQVAGSLMFELFFYPLNPQIEFWLITRWQPLAFIYPLERSLIATLATLVGAPLIRAAHIYGFEIGGK